MMRRASICKALLGLAAIGLLAGLPGAASAAPVVTLKVTPIPIPGFAGTGDILGAGTAVQAEYTISGTESTGGVPSQLRGVTFFSPAGVKLHPQGFTTCSLSTLEAKGPEGCPKKSQASAKGIAGVVDVIGGEPIKENATLQAFFAPNGVLAFYANAASPISAQIIVPGRFMTAAPPFGPELVTEVPIVESVPGAPAVSTTSINIKVGSAYRKHGKTISYITLPSKCPKGGFPVKSELKFESGETVTVPYKAPCPKHKK